MNHNSNLPSTKALIDKYNVRPNKKFGQNFLLDLSLCHKIVKSGLSFLCAKYQSIGKNIDNISVLEIGPGSGILSRSIIENTILKVKKIILVEKDRNLVPLLQEIKNFYQNNEKYDLEMINILENDALKLDFLQIAQMLNNKINVIANLPYNIGTKLILNFLKPNNISHFTSITVMLQKEVALRIAATKGKDYGRLSVICQILCDVKLHFDISPKAFYPSPKIISSVISLIPKEGVSDLITVSLFEILDGLLIFAFSSRRKLIYKSIKEFIAFYQKFKNINWGVENNFDFLDRLIERSQISKTDRPDQVESHKYLNLALQIYKFKI